MEEKHWGWVTIIAFVGLIVIVGGISAIKNSEDSFNPVSLYFFTFLGFLALLWSIGMTVSNILEDKEQERSQQVAIEQEQQFLQQTRTLQDAYNLSPQEFENLIRLLFEKLGYEATGTSYTADGGVDLNLVKDGSREMVQCKRYKGNISVQVVREFFGIMVDQRVTKGYIVTTGHFTLPARRFGEGKGIHLIDGEELSEMLVDQSLI